MMYYTNLAQLLAFATSAAECGGFIQRGQLGDAPERAKVVSYASPTFL